MRASDRGRKRFPKWLIVLAVGVVLIAYLAYPKPMEVKVARVRTAVLGLDLSTTGVVEGEVSDISPRLTSRITSLEREEGDAVKAGQILARLDSADLESQVDGQSSAVRAAEEEAASLQASVSASSDQANAAVSAAKSNRDAAGQLLKQLEAGSRPEEIGAQKAVVARVLAVAQDANGRLRTAEGLHRSGVISTQDLDTAKTAAQTASAELKAQQQVLKSLQAGPRAEEIESARARLKAADAGVKEAQASVSLVRARVREVEAARARAQSAGAALKVAEEQLGYALIRSPISGVVVRRHMEVGELASPLNPIYTVADRRKAWVTAEVDEQDIAAVAVGQKVSLTADAFPGRAAVGTVSRISAIAEPKQVGRVRAKIVRARIEVAEYGIPLHPGMEVNVTGSLPSGDKAVLVPNDAVIRIGDQDAAYVVQDGKAAKREVKIGQANFTDTVIVSGVKEGDEVIVTGLGQLEDGKRVKIIK